MLFSEKCADPDEKSYYACGNSLRPSLFAKVPLLEEITKGKHNYLLLFSKVVNHARIQKVLSEGFQI